MRLAGPWKESWDAHFLEDATAHLLALVERGGRTQLLNGRHPPSYKAQSPRNLQETLGVQGEDYPT